MDDLKSELKSIRKQSRSINNRIQSILYDAKFVLQVGEYFDRPLVANRRCGSWYVPPGNCATSCYFKSTDGHTHQWSFSIRRLNLHLLPLIKEKNGIVIVDSTRRGKLMPDAASKTIPIWCSVINKANGFEGRVIVPPTVVSSSERDQIQAKVDEWAETLKSTSDAYKIDKPLRSIWFNHGDQFYDPAPQLPNDFYPVIICTASFRAQDGQETIQGYTYVQGAADDHELWAGSLTPEKFWSNPQLHQLRSEAELEEMIDTLPDAKDFLHNLVKLSQYLYLSNMPCEHKCVIDVRSCSNKWPVPPGKRGARIMSKFLEQICEFYQEKGPEAIILADTDSDSGGAVCLLLDCLFFDLNGKPTGQRRKSHVQKDEVNQRLAKLTINLGSVPARTTLNIIGSFLRN